jgi:hypothetical protein
MTALITRLVKENVVVVSWSRAPVGEFLAMKSGVLDMARPMFPPGDTALAKALDVVREVRRRRLAACQIGRGRRHRRVCRGGV